MTTITEEKKTLEEIYEDLNSSKKTLMRTAFLEAHGLSQKSDSFYKKINGKTVLKSNEKKWFSAYLEMAIEDIEFPTYTK